MLACPPVRSDREYATVLKQQTWIVARANTSAAIIHFATGASLSSRRPGRYRSTRISLPSPQHSFAYTIIKPARCSVSGASQNTDRISAWLCPQQSGVRSSSHRKHIRTCSVVLPIPRILLPLPRSPAMLPLRHCSPSRSGTFLGDHMYMIAPGMLVALWATMTIGAYGYPGRPVQPVENRVMPAITPITSTRASGCAMTCITRR